MLRSKEDSQRYNVFDDEANSHIDISKAIRQLTYRQQAVIALRFSGYTQQAVTALLGISRTTVWADECCALASLKNIIGLEID